MRTFAVFSYHLWGQKIAKNESFVVFGCFFTWVGEKNYMGRSIQCWILIFFTFAFFFLGREGGGIFRLINGEHNAFCCFETVFWLWWAKKKRAWGSVRTHINYLSLFQGVILLLLTSCSHLRFFQIILRAKKLRKMNLLLFLAVFWLGWAQKITWWDRSIAEF